MRVKVKEDAIIYVPNPEHKNFTESGKFYKAGEIIEGDPKSIKGKRRGEEFTYRMFITKDGSLIHLNKVEAHTEPTSKADGSADTIGGKDVKREISVDYKESHMFIYGAIAGALIGYAYHKISKKGDAKTLSILGAITGAAGALIQVASEKKIINKIKK